MKSINIHFEVTTILLATSKIKNRNGFLPSNISAELPVKYEYLN